MPLIVDHFTKTKNSYNRWGSYFPLVGKRVYFVCIAWAVTIVAGFLKFSGGITAGRGHAGANPVTTAIAAI